MQILSKPNNTEDWFSRETYGRIGFYIPKYAADYIKGYGWTDFVSGLITRYVDHKDVPQFKTALDRYKDTVNSCREGHDPPNALEYHVIGPAHPRVHKQAYLNKAKYNAVAQDKYFLKFVRMVLAAKFNNDKSFLDELGY